MHITKINIVNFKCFDQVTLNLDLHMTVLIGENGTGKTSILESLSIGIQSLFLAHPSIENPRIKESQVKTIFNNHQGVISEHKQYPSSISCIGKIFDKNETTQWHINKESKDKHKSNTTTNPKLYAKLKKFPINSEFNETIPIVVYYGTQRVWAHKANNDWSSAVTNRLIGYVSCFDPASSEKHMASWMRTQAFASAQDGIVPPHVKAIERAVCDCLSQPNKRAVKFFYNIRFERLEIHWEDDAQTPSITPFHELSDGYRNMTAMVADLAWRASVLNPHLLGDAPSQTPGVVLIDEVDLHLHPRWQRRVLGDLLRAFPQVQFVVTTHSPQVISSAKPEWIRILTDEGVVTPTHARGLDSNRILSDLMGVSPRPEETERLIAEAYRAIGAGKLEEAKRSLGELSALLGPLDPAVLRLGYALHEARVSPPKEGEAL